MGDYKPVLFPAAMTLLFLGLAYSCDGRLATAVCGITAGIWLAASFIAYWLGGSYPK